MSMTNSVLAGAAGGLAGGLAMTAFMSVAEATGLVPEPLPLKFNRTFEQMAGVEGRFMPGQEHGLALAEHLAVSAFYGGLYGAISEVFDLDPLPAGPLYGLGVYALMLGAVGPAMDATEGPWNEKPTTAGRRMMMHAVFGTLTAVVCDQIRERTA